VVGEFLEHSRIFIFGREGDPDSSIYIGSADLNGAKPRSTSRGDGAHPKDASLQGELREAF